MKILYTIIKINAYMLLAASLSCYGIEMKISVQGTSIFQISINGAYSPSVATWEKKNIWSYDVSLDFNTEQMRYKLDIWPTSVEVDFTNQKEDIEKITKRITDITENVNLTNYTREELIYDIRNITENSYALLLYEDLTKILKETIPHFDPVHIEAEIPLSGSKPIALSGYQHYTQLMKNYVQSWTNWFTRKRALGAAIGTIGTGLTLGGLYWYYSGKK